jgi:hypothetical protein
MRIRRRIFTMRSPSVGWLGAILGHFRARPSGHLASRGWPSSRETRFPSDPQVQAQGDEEGHAPAPPPPRSGVET